MTFQQLTTGTLFFVSWDKGATYSKTDSESGKNLETGRAARFYDFEEVKEAHR